MKYLILLFTVPLLSISQVDVPEEYWIDDSNFEEAISNKSAFGDEDNKPVLIEFWAEFNEANCFSDWDKVEDVTELVKKTDDTEVIQGEFSLKNLSYFIKCTNLCNNIEMFLENDLPLVVKYSVASLGEIKLCLAPLPAN